MNSVTSLPEQAGQSPSVPAPEPALTIGYSKETNMSAGFEQIPDYLRDLENPVYVLKKDNELLLSRSGELTHGNAVPDDGSLPVVAYLPPVKVSQLGDTGFCLDYGIRFPYMTGAMANGIASTRLVIAVANAGMLGSFGAAGLSVQQVESAVEELQRTLVDKTWCINLIHSPNETGKEDELVDLFIKKQVRLVEASAYLALTLPAVRYRVHGIHRGEQGNIITPNRIIAKASRVEVATRWLSPPPEKFLLVLLEQGVISPEQMELAKQIPMAQDLTVEADSGGHTDNRPAITLLPTMTALCNRLQQQYNYQQPLRVGAAGGIATPASAAAAFSMGAAYIVSGTINQACIESGSSDTVRRMLAEAQQADTAMAAAGDMFEMGVKVQVLKRGTMFAMRGNKLFEVYRKYNSIEEIPGKEREDLEKKIFRASFDHIWQETRKYFSEADPAQISKAEKDPKHKMALIFRWYLGLSSRWANAGVEDRQADYQIWCGPAMGAFNEWVRGSFLERAENRSVVTIALNLLAGAAITSRMTMLRMQGITVPAGQTRIAPMQMAELEKLVS